MDAATIGHMLNTAFVFSTALILAALGGILSERSGVVNIGLEGLMTAGAFAAAVAAYKAQEAGYGGASPWIGVIAGAIFGVLFALIHAVATITFRADQVVSGIVINFIAGGSTLYLVKLLFEGAGETSLVNEVFHKVKIPLLSDIPIIGDGIFNAYPTTYLALILVGAIYYMLYKTAFGLRLRSVGEHPSAADTVGIKVLRMRYAAVLLSGVLAGIGGATIAMTTTGSFSHNTISGQGFIGAVLRIRAVDQQRAAAVRLLVSCPVGVHLHAAVCAHHSGARRRGRPLKGSWSFGRTVLSRQAIA
jgi:ABC-type uncharacterized transport system permease subunit